MGISKIVKTLAAAMMAVGILFVAGMARARSARAPQARIRSKSSLTQL